MTDELHAGVRSPVILTLFLTLVYAALSYPRWMVALVSGVSLLGGARTQSGQRHEHRRPADGTPTSPA